MFAVELHQLMLNVGQILVEFFVLYTKYFLATLMKKGMRIFLNHKTTLFASFRFYYTSPLYKSTHIFG